MENNDNDNGKDNNIKKEQEGEEQGKNASPNNELEELKKELEILKKQNEDHLDGWRRAKADYLNFKKETEKKSKELIQFANAGLILEMLPIYENLKIAFEHIPQEDKKKDWVVGIEHIKKQLDDLLKNLGLEPIESVGKKFDHNIHEAVGSEKAEGKENDIILKEVKGGFKLYGNVLEPAKVIVVKN